MYDKNSPNTNFPANQMPTTHTPTQGQMGHMQGYGSDYAGQPTFEQQQQQQPPYGGQGSQHPGSQAQQGHAMPGAAPGMQHARKNLLMVVTTPLLTLITQIKHTSEHHNVEKLKAQIIDEIKKFEQQLTKASYPPRLIVAARYCLCTAIDEAVLSRPWGTTSIWVQQSLLSLFHKETWGGERFYIILEEMAKDPRQNIDFLEFAYNLLSLGFEGKFYGKNLAVREEIRNRIFYRIRYSKEKPDKTLSRRWLDIKPVSELRQKRSKIKKIGIFTAAAIVMIGLYYNIAVYNNASTLVTKLDGIANVSPITTFSQVISRPIVERGLNQS